MKRRLLILSASLLIIINVLCLLWAADARARRAMEHEAEENKRQSEAALRQGNADYALFLLDQELKHRQQDEARIEGVQEKFRSVRESRRKENQHQELLAEMQEANRIARDAAFQARWPERRTTVTELPKADWYTDYQRQQTFEGIRRELETMRMNQENDATYWRIQDAFPRYY